VKAILGWLGDPYLHLFGIGLIILALGAGLTSESSGSPGPDRCERCLKIHGEAVACAPSVTLQTR
jgi:hypothetical protein